jgi:hypothetical protein
MPKKNIEAIVEIYPFEINPPWEIVSTTEFFRLVLSSEVTDEEIGSLILMACEYNKIEVDSSGEETLESFISKKFVLPGGLQFSEDAQVKIVPGCCCGLETWQDWFGVPSGQSVWSGHDPNISVEFTNDKIRVWQDEKAEGVDFIDFQYDEMHYFLEKVKSDLNNFLYRLNKWSEFIAPGLKGKVSEHFAKSMNI